MSKKIAIYLAGTIQKGHESQEDSFWSKKEIEELKKSLSDFSLSFLNPADRSDDLTDQTSVFGRDMLQVYSSDLVFVDARERRGLGVGAEMMWAKINSIPVITWAPKNSHYQKDDAILLGVNIPKYVHPFVELLSDKIVENLQEAVCWIQIWKKDSSFYIKGKDDIHHAMQYYKTHQLEKDLPMKEMISLLK